MSWAAPPPRAAPRPPSRYACPAPAVSAQGLQAAAAAAQGLLVSLRGGVAELSGLLRGAAAARSAAAEAEDDAEDEDADGGGGPRYRALGRSGMLAGLAQRIPRGLASQLERQLATARLPCVLFPSLANFVSGYEGGVTSFMVMQLTDPGLIGGGLLVLSPWEVGKVLSVRMFGALGGSLLVVCSPTDPSARDVLLWSALGLTAVSVASMTSAGQQHLLLLRLLTGVIDGVSNPAKMAYTTETIDAELRGASAGVRLGAFGLGAAAGAVAGAVLLRIPGSWQVMLGAAALPSLFMAAGMLSLPHSPRWLMSSAEVPETCDRAAEALSALKALRPSVPGVAPELRELLLRRELEAMPLRQPAAAAAPPWTSLGEFMCSPATQISTWVLALKQASGSGIIGMYAAPVLAAIGCGGHVTTLGVVFAGVRVVASPLGIVLMDTLGRRGCLLLGTFGTSVSMLTLAASHGLQPVAPLCTQGVAVAGLLASAALFETCFGASSYTLVSELFPQHRRQQGIAWSHVCNYTVKAFCVQMFPLALALGGPACIWWIFALVNTAGFVVVYRIVPETFGRSLEDVERELELQWASSKL